MHVLKVYRASAGLPRQSLQQSECVCWGQFSMPRQPVTQSTSAPGAGPAVLAAPSPPTCALGIGRTLLLQSKTQDLPQRVSAGACLAWSLFRAVSKMV